MCWTNDIYITNKYIVKILEDSKYEFVIDLLTTTTEKKMTKTSVSIVSQNTKNQNKYKKFTPEENCNSE